MRPSHHPLSIFRYYYRFLSFSDNFSCSFSNGGCSLQILFAKSNPVFRAFERASEHDVVFWQILHQSSEPDSQVEERERVLQGQFRHFHGHRVPQQEGQPSLLRRKAIRHCFSSGNFHAREFGAKHRTGSDGNGSGLIQSEFGSTHPLRFAVPGFEAESELLYFRGKSIFFC